MGCAVQEHTALMWACCNKDAVAVLDKLLSHGADIHDIT